MESKYHFCEPTDNMRCEYTAPRAASYTLHLSTAAANFSGIPEVRATVEKPVLPVVRETGELVNIS